MYATVHCIVWADRICDKVADILIDLVISNILTYTINYISSLRVKWEDMYNHIGMNTPLLWSVLNVRSLRTGLTVRELIYYYPACHPSDSTVCVIFQP